MRKKKRTKEQKSKRDRRHRIRAEKKRKQHLLILLRKFNNGNKAPEKIAIDWGFYIDVEENILYLRELKKKSREILFRKFGR